MAGQRISSAVSVGISARIEALLDAVSIERVDVAGALTVAQGHCVEQPVRLALTDRSVAGGSLGVSESDFLGSVFAHCREEAMPVALILDSAGARLTSGLAGLGAFRRMYRAALELRLAGVPMVALLERNCFGGASMLAMLCGARGALQPARIGMSGPAVIEALAGKQDIDASDRDAVRELFGAPARFRAGAINEVFAGGDLQRDMLATLLRQAAATPLDVRRDHDKLQQRLRAAGVALPAVSLAEASQLFRRGTPVGAIEIWQLADALLRTPDAKAITLRIDCPGQAATRRDESVVLSEYVAHLALCLAERCASGSEIVTRIEGECSGGIYVALAAGVACVEAAPGARLRVLPEKAVTVVMGQTPLTETLNDALDAGVVDRLVSAADDAQT